MLLKYLRCIYDLFIFLEQIKADLKKTQHVYNLLEL